MVFQAPGPAFGEAMILGARIQYFWLLVLLAIALGTPLALYSRRQPRDQTVRAEIEPIRYPAGDLRSQSAGGALEEARLTLEAIRRSAKQSAWGEAKRHFLSFQTATRVLPRPQLRHPDVSMVLLDLFSLYSVQLQRATEREDLSAVFFASNQLEGIVEDWIAQFDPGRPRELGRLRYLSRDLIYWAGAGDEQMLELRSQGLETLWSDLRPLVLYRNAPKAAERFDLVLLQLKSAQRREDFETLSPQLHEALVGVEAALSKQ